MSSSRGSLPAREPLAQLDDVLADFLDRRLVMLTLPAELAHVGGLVGHAPGHRPLRRRVEPFRPQQAHRRADRRWAFAPAIHALVVNAARWVAHQRDELLLVLRLDGAGAGDGGGDCIARDLPGAPARAEARAGLPAALAVVAVMRDHAFGGLDRAPADLAGGHFTLRHRRFRWFGGQYVMPCAWNQAQTSLSLLHESRHPTVASAIALWFSAGLARSVSSALMRALSSTSSTRSARLPARMSPSWAASACSWVKVTFVSVVVALKPSRR